MTGTTDIEKKIVAQVEYYFNDINLTKDRFLRNKLTENDGWVDFNVLLTFNRLKSMTNDVAFLKEALSKSSNKILEVNDKAVRRVVPFQLVENEDIFDKFANETVFVKGFASDTTLEGIEEWFEKTGIVPKSIHMRKFPIDKKFKGSIFATFPSHEDAEKFLKSEEASKFKDNLLIRKWQQDFKKEKDEERTAREDEKKKRQDLQNKARRKDAENQMVKCALLELSNLPAKEERPAAGEKRPAPAGDDAEEGEEKKTSPMIDFKAWISQQLGEELAKGMWLDMQPNENKVTLRLKTENSATEAKKLFEEKGLKYKDHDLIPRIITGDEEINYWTNYFSIKNNKSHKRNQGHHGGQGGKRRRRG